MGPTRLAPGIDLRREVVDAPTQRHIVRAEVFDRPAEAAHAITEPFPGLDGVVDAAMLGTPPRLLARKMGFRELLDLDGLGVLIPYVGVSALKATVKKNPDTTAKLVATLTDAIHVFKTDKEKSLFVMKKYLRGASEEILGQTYDYFSSRTQKFPYPSIEAIKTALEMLSDEYPQARSVDPNEIADLSFVERSAQGPAEDFLLHVHRAW